jgi:hypothetical protein
MPDEAAKYIGRKVGVAPPAAPTRPRRGRRRSGGRFEILNTFVDESLRQLHPTAAVVWLVLFRDTKPDGLARTGQTDLARRTGRSIRTIYTALRRLQVLGLLTVVRRGRLSAGATIYRVWPLARDDIQPATGCRLAIGNPLRKLRQPAAGIPEWDQKRRRAALGRRSACRTSSKLDTRPDIGNNYNA